MIPACASNKSHEHQLLNTSCQSEAIKYINELRRHFNSKYRFWICIYFRWLEKVPIVHNAVFTGTFKDTLIFMELFLMICLGIMVV